MLNSACQLETNTPNPRWAPELHNFQQKWNKCFAPNGNNTLPAIQYTPSSFGRSQERKSLFLRLPLATCSLKFKHQPVREEHPFHALAYGNPKAVVPRLCPEAQKTLQTKDWEYIVWFFISCSGKQPHHIPKDSLYEKTVLSGNVSCRLGIKMNHYTCRITL